MKFLCIDCDQQMDFGERQLPGDGTLAAVFRCPACGREVAMLTNPMETQVVSSLGIKIGGREVPEQPLEMVRSSLDGGRDGAFADPPVDPATSVTSPATSQETSGTSPGTSPVEWSEAATQRLEAVPSFVRGMVKRIYTDYAKEHGIHEITPEIMNRARTDLGLEGM
jgi:hypothetical protein